ncbi:hypothetical protein OsI_34291 [Oryza sativa Indica Group]|jgi:hypothetical protein|uniref:Uncharacterized protein n=5 Tax=Oryza TaxID=4527 RepID=A0A0D3HFJ6_9ORYZ|nr:hypothetical protein OsI_34291 [Oryza sativa Indica Group]
MVRPPPSSDDDPLVPQFGRQIDSGVVAAAGGNLVALYAGPYRPASSSMGCYLVYDAAARSSSPPLSTVPGVPYSDSHSSPGRATVIAPAATGGGFMDGHSVLPPSTAEITITTWTLDLQDDHSTSTPNWTNREA